MVLGWCWFGKGGGGELVGNDICSNVCWLRSMDMGVYATNFMSF